MTSQERTSTDRSPSRNAIPAPAVSVAIMATIDYSVQFFSKTTGELVGRL